MAVRAAGLKRRNAIATKARIETLESRLLLSAVSLSKPVTSSISTTGPASQVLVGDLNGDGIPDLVTGSAGTAAVLGGFTAQVFLGSSSGSFKAGNIVPTGGQAIALGDFNGDGKLDLATAAGVLPGNGNGSFGAAISGFTLPANTIPVSFFTGDFNGDSKLDLAMVTFTSASGASPAKIGLGILIGNGNGTFQSPVTTSVASGTNLNQSEAVFATGDFNGDGNLDVVSPFGVLLGNGKGGFTAPSSGLPVASTPVSSAFAVGDFNGDGKLDLAMVPPGAAAGQIAILPGNGNGTFATPVPVVINTGGGKITALAAADVDGDGKLDLIAATTQNGNSPAINILIGNGNNTFTTAQTLTPSAIPVALFTADFNGDKALDLLSVNQASGTSGGGIAGLNAASVDVFLSSTPATTPATVTLTSSAQTALLGAKVILSAKVTGSAGAAAPTGTVTFTSGKNTLGTVPIRAGGVAALVTSTLPVGIQQIIATYNGDANYASVKSAPIRQTVLATLSKTPLLVATLGAIRFPGSFVSGDRGTINVTITNGGGAIANGRVAVNLYLSTDGTLAHAAPLTIRSSNRIAIHLPSARSTSVALPIAVGDLPAGKYRIVAQMLGVTGFTPAQVSSTPVPSAAQLQAAGHVFGSFAGRRNVSITVVAPDGRIGVLRLTGAGAGTYSIAGRAVDLTVSGTRPASKLQISGDGAFPIGTLAVSGPLARLDARGAAVTGAIELGGNVKQLLLGNVSGAALASSGSLRQATVTDLGSSNWAVAGDVGSLSVFGSLSADTIYAGNDAGPDHIPGTADDTYRPAVIGSIKVKGGITSSTIGAGIQPPSGGLTLLQGGLIPGGKIRSITVRSAVSSDTRFLAASLPKTAILDGTRVNTSTDPRFEV